MSRFQVQRDGAWISVKNVSSSSMMDPPLGTQARDIRRIVVFAAGRPYRQQLAADLKETLSTTVLFHSFVRSASSVYHRYIPPDNRCPLRALRSLNP